MDLDTDTFRVDRLLRLRGILLRVQSRCQRSLGSSWPRRPACRKSARARRTADNRRRTAASSEAPGRSADLQAHLARRTSNAEVAAQPRSAAPDRTYPRPSASGDHRRQGLIPRVSHTAQPSRQMLLATRQASTPGTKIVQRVLQADTYVSCVIFAPQPVLQTGLTNHNYRRYSSQISVRQFAHTSYVYVARYRKINQNIIARTQYVKIISNQTSRVLIGAQDVR
jgi:hypothetical protein